MYAIYLVAALLFNIIPPPPPPSCNSTLNHDPPTLGLTPNTQPEVDDEQHVNDLLNTWKEDDGELHYSKTPSVLLLQGRGSALPLFTASRVAFLYLLLGVGGVARGMGGGGRGSEGWRVARRDVGGWGTTEVNANTACQCCA